MNNSDSNASPHLVEIRNVSRSFGQNIALNNVSLNVVRGTILGLIGGNGAGKTTLIRHIMGMFKPQTGTVAVFGLNPVSSPERVLSRIGYLSEDRDLPNWMRVKELMRYTRAFFKTWDDRYAEELREMFDLDPTSKVRDLSRGQRARAGLLAALAHRPELLVLDEPSSGLDPIVRRDILGAIIRTIADEGRTVLFSSHLLDEVERVADHVAIIHKGSVLLTSSMDDIKQSHRRLTLRFDHAISTAPSLVGALQSEGEGSEWSYVCRGQRDQLRNAAAALGASVVAEEELSLDEIFITQTSKA